MSNTRVYENSVLAKARQSIRSGTFLDLVAKIDSEIAVIAGNFVGEKSQASFYIDRIAKKCNVEGIWYLEKQSDLDHFYSGGNPSYHITVLVLCEKALAIATLNGNKSNTVKLGSDAHKQTSWDSTPRLNQDSLVIIPLASIASMDRVRFEHDHKQEGAFATTRTVSREPDYLGAALVGSAVGGNIGAVAAVSYEASRPRTKTIGYYLPPRVKAKDTGELSFFVDGPAELRAIDTNYLTVRAQRDSQLNGYEVTIRVPKITNANHWEVKASDDSGKYNAKLEDQSHRRIAAFLTGIEGLAAKEAQLATAYDRRYAWFGVGVEEPIAEKDDKLAIMYGDDLEEAFAFMQGRLLRKYDVKLEILTEETVRKQKQLKRTRFRAKLFGQTGSKNLAKAEQACQKAESEVEEMKKKREIIASAVLPA